MAESQEKVIKEGFLQKKSRYLGAWRERYTVLMADPEENNVYRLCTFVQRTNYESQKPTEYIRIDNSTEIKATTWATGNDFFIENRYFNEKFLFTATNADMRDEWVQSLLLKTDVGLLNDDSLFDDNNLCHNNNKTKKRHRNYNKKKAASYGIVAATRIETHIDEMRKRQINNNNGASSSYDSVKNGGDIDINEKIMHWIEVEILLKTNDCSYFELIITNEFDNLEIIQKITNQNLVEIGISESEHRMQIMDIIENISILVQQTI